MAAALSRHARHMRRSSRLEAAFYTEAQERASPMPDLQFVDTTVDFSKKVFHAVTEVCAHFGIRHPEELSLLKPPIRNGEKKEKRPARRNSKRRNSQGSEHSTNSDDAQPGTVTADGRLTVPGQQTRTGTGSLNGSSHSTSTPGSPKSHRSSTV